MTRQLKQIVDLLKPQQRKRIRYQEEGDGLELETAIRAAIDQRVGSTQGICIHQSHERDGRDISGLLPLGSSQSINDVPEGSDCSNLQLSHEAVWLTAEAVEARDPFAVAGFLSNTSHEVRYSHFKGFGEEWGADARRA